MRLIVVKFAVLLVINLIVVFYDIRSCRVPNYLVMSGLMIGFGCKICELGFYAGMFWWFVGVLIPVLLFFLLFMMRVLGAGDIKLYSVIGGIMGVSYLVWIICVSFVIGAVMSFIHLIRCKTLNVRMHYLAEYISYVIEKKSVVKYYVEERDRIGGTIHFTVAILLGNIILFFRYLIP